MDLLKKLETKANEYWRMANAAKGLQREQLLKLHREAYRKFKAQRNWLAAMGAQNEHLG